MVEKYNSAPCCLSKQVVVLKIVNIAPNPLVIKQVSRHKSCLIQMKFFMLPKELKMLVVQGIVRKGPFFLFSKLISFRFCMGAAWRDLAGRKSNFNKILDHVKVIR